MGGRKRKNLPLRDGLYIIGEGLTEQCYFKYLKKINNYRCTVKPRFFENTDISHIEKTTERLLESGVSIVCVFDADVSNRDEKERQRFRNFKHKYQHNRNVLICESLPSIEFWFLLHFEESGRSFTNPESVEFALTKHIHGYRKQKDFLDNQRWVESINDRIDIACRYARSLPSDGGGSYSKIYLAIEKLEQIKSTFGQ